MTTILHAVKGGLLSYCDKIYSRGDINQKHRIGGVMVSVVASSAVDRGFEPRSGQTKDYKIGICCFSAFSVSVSYHYKNPTQRVGLEQSGPHHHLIENLLVLAII